MRACREGNEVATRTVGGLCLCLLILACGVVAQADYEPVFEEWECPFPLDGITCGFLVVPEDRSDPEGNQVELPVVLIHSRADEPAPDPVIYLEGGPGGAGLLALEDLQRHPILDERDLIVFDQRGTGFALPSLNCPESEAGDENATEACRDRLLDEGINLDAYNSAASAADIRDLVFALGFEQVNLWGVSYGTKLALTTLRDHPDVVRSVILDSVYPPEVDDLTLQAESLVGAYQALFERCAVDDACDAAFPDLEATLYDAVVAYNDQPFIFETDEGEVELTGDELLAQLFLALYDSQRLPYLPYALALIAGGEDEDAIVEGYDILTGAYLPDDESELPPSLLMDSEFVQDYFEQYGEIDDSEGMNLSFDCSEEYQLDDLDAAYAAAEIAPEPLIGYFVGGIDSAVAECELWGVQTADSLEAERVESDIPALVISGAMDPVTPPSSGDSAAAGLSNSWHIVFPTAGHGISFTDNEAGECAKTLVTAFLNDPTAPLDTSCVEETDVIDFYMGG